MEHISDKLADSGNVDAVIIDDLQHLQRDKARKFRNRIAEEIDITSGLKQMAKETGLPFIVCSQLSEVTEQRTDKRPMLSDLRASGILEQEADIILFPYRKDYYDGNSIKAEEDTIIVARNRYGEIGSISVQWDEERTVFTDCFSAVR